MNDMASACDIGCDEYGYPIRWPGQTLTVEAVDRMAVIMWGRSDDWMYKSIMREVPSLPDAASLPRARDPNEMVDRVGVALRAACLEEFGTNWCNDVVWKFAKAAIAAMRVPTQTMLDVAQSELPAIHQFGQPTPGFLAPAYSAMIDAALNAPR